MTLLYVSLGTKHEYVAISYLLLHNRSQYETNSARFRVKMIAKIVPSYYRNQRLPLSNLNSLVVYTLSPCFISSAQNSMHTAQLSHSVSLIMFQGSEMMRKHVRAIKTRYLIQFTFKKVLKLDSSYTVS